MMSRQRWEPSFLIVACFSRHPSALDWAAGRLHSRFGGFAAVSPDYDFHHTTYYAATMGPSLRKRFLVFDQLQPPSILPGVKNYTIGLEHEAALRGTYPEPRPLNLDPGLLQLGKLALATTKDQSHRTYLGQGIYVENTLRFEAGSFTTWPWTYADYREPELHSFLNGARATLYERIVQLRPGPKFS